MEVTSHPLFYLLEANCWFAHSQRKITQIHGYQVMGTIERYHGVVY